MDGWISIWRQKKSASRQRNWLWVLAAVLLLFIGTGWGVINFTWKQVTIAVDGKQIETRTFASNVARLLAENHISLGAEDTVIPALDTPVTKNMTVEVKRAIGVKIEVDGQEKEILISPSARVIDVLTKAGISLNTEDRVTPELNSTVAAGDKIKVTRVTTETVTTKNEINYRVERRSNGQIEKGITQVLQRGQKGIQEDTYRIVYEDGQEVSRELLSTKIVKEPVPEIVSVGTLNMASRGGESFRFERVFTATATAYTHTGNRTKTGVWPRVGTIAVDPTVIPLGTRLYVEGYGFGVAQDVGSAIKGNRIDVFLDTEAATARWGVRQVKVYVLP